MQMVIYDKVGLNIPTTNELFNLDYVFEKENNKFRVIKCRNGELNNGELITLTRLREFLRTNIFF